METPSDLHPELRRAGPIVVIGSVNMDLVCRVPRLPRPGETVTGTHFATIPGGKGANQAVAAARLGGEVHLVARVGDDDFGRRLLAGLTSAGVNTAHTLATPGSPSGCAMICVDDRGQNTIAVIPGANGLLAPADVDAARDLIASAAAVLMQLEVPIETVRHAVALCRQANVLTILDPAPVPPGGLPADLFAVDVLTPNESEAAALLTGQVGPAHLAAPEERASRLLAKGCRALLLKLGEDGAMLATAGGGPPHQFPPFKANVVDTTAAGDAFGGALAVALSEGVPLAQAVPFANAAGALCCETLGAQPAMPGRSAVDALLRRRAVGE